jgi:hypothetical protein
MKLTLVGCVLSLLLGIAATCGTVGDRESSSFPGPDQLSSDPEFTVLVDAWSISGDPLLILATHRTFEELHDDFVPRLSDHGWSSVKPSEGFPESNAFSAEQGDSCIYYWNMSPGSWAPGMKAEAERENPQFQEQATNFTTVFRVWIDDCA